MRVNIYAEEMTDRVELISKEIEGRTYTAVRFYLELPATVNGENVSGPFIHRPGDDDSSAVTFWGKQDMRPLLRRALEILDAHYADKRSNEAGLPMVGHKATERPHQPGAVPQEELRALIAKWRTKKWEDDHMAQMDVGVLFFPSHACADELESLIERRGK